MAKKHQHDNRPYFRALVRISLGLVFLWAFFDKLWGLGFATCRHAKTGAVDVLCDAAWVNGGSPTTGFLKFGTKGPLADFYQSLAGNPLVDWLFMLGLLGIGIGLLFGIAMKLSVVSGTVMLLMMYSAVLPPANHPLIDDHIVNSLVLMALLATNQTQKWGFRNWWVRQPLVQRYKILE